MPAFAGMTVLSEIGCLDNQAWDCQRASILPLKEDRRKALHRHSGECLHPEMSSM